MTSYAEHSKPNVPGWIERVPTETEVELFNEGRMPSEQPALAANEIRLNPIEVFVANIISHFHPEARVLDVGCGNGKLIVALLHGEYIASGAAIDASETMIVNARQTAANVGVTVAFSVGTLEHIKLAEQYDVIIAKDVLEHLYDVTYGLSVVAGMLADAGMICGSVPLLNTCDCDAHLQHFTVASLRGVLSKFFNSVATSVVDLTGLNELHIRYTAREPKG